MPQDNNTKSGFVLAKQNNASAVVSLSLYLLVSVNNQRSCAYFDSASWRQGALVVNA